MCPSYNAYMCKSLLIERIYTIFLSGEKGVPCLYFLSVAIIKHFNQMPHLDEESIYSTVQSIAERSQHRMSRQGYLLLFRTALPPAREPGTIEVQQKPGRNAAGWLAHWIMSSANLLIMPRTSLPKVGS